MSRAFHIGGESAEHVAVEVVAREHPDQSDYWDGNWLTAWIDLASGPFRGKYRAALRAEEFVHFRDQLQTLFESGRAQTEPFFDSHNVLYFVLELDQSFLPDVLAELKGVIQEFPVVGSPHDKAAQSR
ncbi:MAG: hypothetical protein E6I95_03015 [Chloroflexi bacterium]|nr:MAG: hypothetical protein E6I95_03015 [Chloroflexota bacterium]